MNENLQSNEGPPRRRWFQFRVSTWFVLVAIVAWAMMAWPWVIEIPSASPYLKPWRMPNPALGPPALAVLLVVALKFALAGERRKKARLASRKRPPQQS